MESVVTDKQRAENLSAVEMTAPGAKLPFAGMSVVGLNNGKHLLALSFSAFDPQRTWSPQHSTK
jgi:hypothetical protein